MNREITQSRKALLKAQHTFDKTVARVQKNCKHRRIGSWESPYTYNGPRGRRVCLDCGRGEASYWWYASNKEDPRYPDRQLNGPALQIDEETFDKHREAPIVSIR